MFLAWQRNAIYWIIGLFTCHFSSNLEISNSFEKLRSFWIQICKAFFSKPLFRGRAFDLKFCITTKEYIKLDLSVFRGNVLTLYHEWEHSWLYCSHLGLCKKVLNFRSNSRPLNINLEGYALHNQIQNDLSFSKLFEICKSDKLWQDTLSKREHCQS